MREKTPTPRMYHRANILKDIDVDIKGIKRYMKSKTEFYNYPVAFDIETSSFRDENGEPRATMYIWQMCFGDGDFFVYGRTWEEWKNFIKLIRKKFHLKKDRCLVVYVHNLAYEIQFIRTFFEWQKIFALEERVPLYARTNFGLEFRCSYRLSGYSLATLAKNLTRHNLKKLDTLDYDKIRHSNTPITDKEMAYNMADVEIVCAYISERLEIDGNITKIPLTKTGYVRNACKIACYGTDHKAKKYFRYRELMQKLTIEPHEYLLLKRAFAGGFTHANSFYVGDVVKDVTSQDFTSSYPFVLFSEKYPFSKGEYTEPTLEELYKDLDKYAWIIDLEFWDIESTILQDNYISKSKCVEIRGGQINNGRVVRATYIHVTITSVDFKIIMKTYRCLGGVRVLCAYKYYLSYLPTDFINEMLNYYVGKTSLKGVAGKEEEYLYNKEQLNSFYGMIVTNPLRDNITYECNEWGRKQVNLFEGVKKYNNNINRFMFYPVGVFVTAYARRNLWDGILSVGADYVYSDTDSIKLTNYKAHEEYFARYNSEVVKKLKRACDYHNIEWERVAPKTIKGVEKILGVWDYDGHYSRFKTLGAKRYMTESAESGDISLTVSGLNKKTAIPYLLDKYGREGIFNAFRDDEFGVDNMIIPEGFSGRMVSTYIDHPTRGTVTDYLGTVAQYAENTSVNLENSTYTLSLSKDYIEYLFGIKRSLTV